VKLLGNQIVQLLELLAEVPVGEESGVGISRWGLPGTRCGYNVQPEFNVVLPLSEREADLVIEGKVLLVLIHNDARRKSFVGCRDSTFRERSACQSGRAIVVGLFFLEDDEQCCRGHYQSSGKRPDYT
jgi:hypothetical protein